MNTQKNIKTNNLYQLIRRPDKLSLKGRSKSSNYNDEQQGLCVPPISIGQRAVAYIKHEVEAIIQARIEGRSIEQIKALVQELIANRTANNGGVNYDDSCR
ncbi:MAG: prophage regulatory protein [Colwellia sp.]|jgi:prophage regulatory protein